MKNLKQIAYDALTDKRDKEAQEVIKKKWQAAELRQAIEKAKRQQDKDNSESVN
jgi:hypothetical protein